MHYMKKIRQDKIIKAYLNDKLSKEIPTILLPTNPNTEVYKLLVPGKTISPFIFDDEIYFFEDVLKVPIELQTLDLFYPNNINC